VQQKAMAAVKSRSDQIVFILYKHDEDDREDIDDVGALIRGFVTILSRLGDTELISH
jgi:hypothetical protein